MPKCTINGQPIEVKEGSTIMQAFYALDEKIAHYCYHPGLSVAGVCRLCIVEIEGNPRPQIACNTVVTEGMKITNKSEKVKEGAKWILDFHLINHPLDCPICDQAGECGLQEQYMEFGKYDPEMAEKKVKKKKVVDLGPTVVLDSERCILCSRCVRFTDEVSKTYELGIFNRGDRSEVGTVEGKKLDNKYSLNTVDICPVGALTSKDFRFRQRVWYLKDSQTVCNGCSTGCSVKVYFNKEGLFRVKPAFNEKVNGHWMCDEGRDIYKFANKETRVSKGLEKISAGSAELAEKNPGSLASQLSAALKKIAPEQIAVVVTGQYTVEEYQEVFQIATQTLKTKQIYHWINNKESFDAFDGLLLRGDKNPNTKGLLKAFESFSISAPWSELESSLSAGKIQTLIVLGPENPAVYPDLAQKLKTFKQSKNLIWLGTFAPESWAVGSHVGAVIPMKSFVEKSGTFINHAGLEQKFNKVTTIVPEALTAADAFRLLAGLPVTLKSLQEEIFVESLRKASTVRLEHRKKNEFVFKRGSL